MRIMEGTPDELIDFLSRQQAQRTGIEHRVTESEIAVEGPVPKPESIRAARSIAAAGEDEDHHPHPFTIRDPDFDQVSELLAMLRDAGFTRSQIDELHQALAQLAAGGRRMNGHSVRRRGEGFSDIRSRG